MSDDLKHDQMCFDQTREIAQQAERQRQFSETQDEIVARLNEAIKEWHGTNTILGRMDERLARVEKDVEHITATLNEKVTWKEDFVTVRNQLWAGIGVIVSLFLASLFYMVAHQGLGK